MIINENLKMGYCAMPRTAGTSTVKFLTTKYRFKEINEVNKGPISYGPSIYAKHKPLTAPPPKGWRFFTTVRNPFDHLVSWWFFVGQDIPFGVEFIDSLFVKPRMGTFNVPRMLPDPARLCGLHHKWTEKIRFENLAGDLAELGFPGDLPHINKGVTQRGNRHRNRDHRIFYDEATRKYVEKRFALELEEYGYEF